MGLSGQEQFEGGSITPCTGSPENRKNTDRNSSQQERQDRTQPESSTLWYNFLDLRKKSSYLLYQVNYK
jgi:hypothetical protein